MPIEEFDFATDFIRVRTITFDNGDEGTIGHRPGPGFEIVKGSATGIVVKRIDTNSDWAGGNAAGTIYYLNTSGVEFTTGGTITVTNSDSTVAPTVIGSVADGALDSRHPNAQYIGRIQYTPSPATSDPVYLTRIDGCLVIKNTASDLYGFGTSMDDVNDRLSIPINFDHGVRKPQRAGGWYAFGWWDDLAADPNGLLNIFIFFEGLEGIGDDSNTTWLEAIMSARIGASAEQGTLKDLDLDELASVGIVIDYGTSDGGSGGSSKPTSLGLKDDVNTEPD